MSRAGALSLVVVALLAGAGAAHADHHGLPDPPGWTQLLPGLSDDQQAQPAPLERCPRLRTRCVVALERRLAALRDELGCDHRAVFAGTYRQVTEQAIVALRERLFRHPRWLIAQDLIFGDFYVDTLAAHAAGEPVPRAWEIALDTAASGDANAGQDLLLGINAHVQRDQPFTIAAIGVNTRRGRSRKVDHERFNTVLSRSYDPIVEEIARRYDPLMGVADGGPSPVDDWGGLELVRGWREAVWRNAERLLEARTAAERERVATSIEVNAAAWAAAIAAGEIPGWRSRRDAYCAAAAT